MSELMLLENRSPMPRIDLGTRLREFRSFQAYFYPLNEPRCFGEPPRLVKKYTHEPVYDGFFPFHNPKARLDIMKREVTGMEILAPELAGEVISANFFIIG